MSDFPGTAVAIAAATRSGALSAREFVESALSRIEATRGALNAFTNVTAARARAEAEAIDQAVAEGRDPGPLGGVPFAVKNLFDLEGEITLAGSKINRDRPAAEADATAVARLRAAGAICLGALNMGEYAYDFVTENPHDGATRNPWDLARSAGGSSGGSGAAVAAGLAAIALGSDTNGSIRVPASFCGIWGLRPTYGALSRGGAFAFVDSLDTIGPFARSPADLAAAFDAMSGPDARDAACASHERSRLLDRIDEPRGAPRVALLGGYFGSGGDAAIHDAARRVAEALGAAEEIELPQPELARAAAYVITAAESGQRHLERLRSRASDFDPFVRDRLFAGAATPATWYLQAQRFRAWWRERVAEVFERFDILIAPATPSRAPMLGQQSLVVGGKEMPLRPNIGLFTQPISLVGLPILAAPVHLPDGLPCAVQLVGRPGSESLLLQAGRFLEQCHVCRAPISQLAAPNPSLAW